MAVLDFKVFFVCMVVFAAGAIVTLQLSSVRVVHIAEHGSQPKKMRFFSSGSPTAHTDKVTILRGLLKNATLENNRGVAETMSRLSNTVDRLAGGVEKLKNDLIAESKRMSASVIQELESTAQTKASPAQTGLESTLSPSVRILIAIPASLKFLETRVFAIFDTWGKKIPAMFAVRLFFARGVAAEAKRMLVEKYGSTIANCVLAIDTTEVEYPPVRRNTEMWKAVALISEATPGLEWVLKVDDDTYVNMKGLEDLVKLFDPENAYLLGGRGYGRPADKDFLDLSEPMCMGGPGYMVTTTALRLFAPSLRSCAEGFDKHEHREALWHSDVIISKCIYEYAGLGCWNKGAEKVKPFHVDIFKQHYKSQKPIYDSVTYHPLKTYAAMVAHHKKVVGLHWRAPVTPRHRHAP